MAEYDFPANYPFWLTAIVLCMIGLLAGTLDFFVLSLCRNSWCRRSKVVLLLVLITLLLKDAASLLKDGDERLTLLAWFAVVSAGILVIEGVSRRVRDAQGPRTLAVCLMCTAAVASVWFTQRVHFTSDLYYLTHTGELKPKPAGVRASMASYMSVDGLYTDKGNPVPVSRLIDKSPQPGSSGLSPDRAFAHLWPHILQVAPASLRSNCHGWVFTHGEFVVPPAFVSRILEDNDYHPVDDPRPGDLIVYRNSLHGGVTHSGVVEMMADGHILIESKWDNHGCYLHEPQNSIYADHFTYYRSTRHGHLLRGLEEALQKSKS